MSQETRQEARLALRVLKDTCMVDTVAPSTVRSVRYDRLSEDYRELHALCYFLLSSSGPGTSTGDTDMIPFLVDMPHLFEKFVGSWLSHHVGPELRLEQQETHELIGSSGGRFEIDFVLYDGNQPVAVADTKYKVGTILAAQDVEQIVAYAVAKGCQTAYLIYPHLGPSEWCDSQVGPVRVCAVSFELSREVNQAGNALRSRFQNDLYDGGGSVG